MTAARWREEHAFEDQYISSVGQLYALMMGHDRWVADLRPLTGPLPARRGFLAPLCSHPYDLCTELIARGARGDHRRCVRPAASGAARRND